jgi:hypothetical protein
MNITIQLLWSLGRGRQAVPSRWQATTVYSTPKSCTSVVAAAVYGLPCPRNSLTSLK